MVELLIVKSKLLNLFIQIVSDLNLYPNPTDGAFHIVFGKF
jgi:hypothetical protein